VAYVVRRDDEKKDKGFSQIWMTSVDGKTTLPLSASYANAGSPKWNPDGTTIAFTGTRGDKDAKSQVWLLDRRGGEAQQYTHVKQGVGGFSWSPDGKRMLITIKDRDPEDLQAEADLKAKVEGAKKYDPKKARPFVIDRQQFKRDYVGYLDRRRNHYFIYDGEGDPVQITSGDYDVSSAVWSPSGDRIAFTSKREGDPDANDNSDIWTVSTDTSLKSFPLTQVTTNKGSDSSPAWSPDGKTIAHTTNVEPEKFWYATEDLAIIDAAGGGTAKLLTAEFDRMIRGPKYSTDGSEIYFTAAHEGNNPLMTINVSSGELTTVTTGGLAIRGYDLHPSGLIAMGKTTNHLPTEVHVIGADGVETRITKLNDENLAGLNLARVERLKVAGYNGDMVESFIYYPPNHKAGTAYPTIFMLHGGPVSQYTASFSSWGQLLAAQGYVVAQPNPHGSNGYGQAFTYELNRAWGVSDFADVMAVADHLVATGVSDGDKLGVGGWSYGGILTNYMITQSTRFKGAVTGASEVNHRANYGHDVYQLTWEAEFGLPWENIEAWEKINPFNNIGKITTPTLVMGGQIDWNVPIQNSEQLYQGLKRLGIDTQLVVYPGEYHGFRRPSFKRDRLERYIAWFKKYVKGE
jgi:dipeptidyl aminopeptidase/acylaminoacyl peptidase